MKKLLSVLAALAMVASIGTVISAAETDYEPAKDSVLITGELIGSEAGWGDNLANGRAAAFDGNTETFFDPPTQAVDYAGIDAGEKMIITNIRIHPRADQLGRFNGATIEAANNADFSDAVVIYTSTEAAAEAGYIDVSLDINAENNTGYRYFRYINYTEHGDVAEVELYGYAQPGPCGRYYPAMWNPFWRLENCNPNFKRNIK